MIFRLFPPPRHFAPVVLVWWGTWPRGATLGDRLAVDNLSEALTAAGLEHTVLSHPSHAGPGHCATRHPFGLAPRIRTLVFVCGPLVGTKRVKRLLRLCRGSRKLAAGVSLLESQQAVNSQLAAVVARDGVPGASFDLAVHSCRDPRQRPRPASLADARVGICLRGPQKDYGASRDHSGRAAELIHAAVGATGPQVVLIDTVLTPSNPPEAIQQRIASVDLLLTTRLHGSLLALAEAVPVIAIDQIAAGGKLTEVLGRTGWPHLFQAEACTPEQLRELITELLEHPPLQTLASTQARLLELAGQALEASVAMVRAAVTADPPGPSGP
ncbi:MULTISPECIES: polysaccharide pyruvyl transferase family protein [Aphanothece]|uniref:polysaccharide pyruvyl transferase family protein n=1 Tax=Aphanothece TaxID=1121 RepID=UPI00398499A9